MYNVSTEIDPERKKDQSQTWVVGITETMPPNNFIVLSLGLTTTLLPLARWKGQCGRQKWGMEEC